ncbi:hypothetical protein C8A05DRAFT_42316 [Staphylotrichum tortipilum]|uniref:Uncharacterized protein n=1 Tax=Staphylotrichum tortipilum TaxID=2831512 RepID=A0AAN6MPE3_9PEZI|nr:hypothetical protein C8A05DRAFT_42316 [Staphylotrichum longicolle]
MTPPTGDDGHYHPKDAIHVGLRATAVYGSIGLLFAAVRNSLAKKHVGPWATFTKGGGIIATFAIAGSAYEFTTVSSANLREKDDYVNHGVGGFVGGALLGIRTGSIARVLGFGTLTAVLLAAYEFTGASIKGNKDQQVDEYERKELLRVRRRKPIEETLAIIGEGRGIEPPGYEERRRARLKEKYGVDIKPVCADPNAA